MYNLIARYIERLTKDDINNFALSKNATLSTDELDFIYLFVKKNWQQVLKNPKVLDLERYKNRFSPENYQLIVKLFNEYSTKYSAFLN